MREQTKTGSVVNSYVIDDGWNIPQEVIEVIDLRIEKAWEDAYLQVIRQNEDHQGDWITKDIALNYAKKAKPILAFNGNQYIGMVRKLGEEMQRKYGVTELEATNILRGNHIVDYAIRYDMIKNLIPVFINSQDICEDVLVEYGYLDDVI